MSNNLVGYSRAGDVFHYLWAARRCLKLLYPNSLLRSVDVEGSEELEKAGEYVIDVSEYYGDGANTIIKYFQLKHTTVRVNDSFTISDLKQTIEGFAERFVQHYGNEMYPQDIKEISFTIITNRRIDQDLKNNLTKIAQQQTVSSKFKVILQKYTKLKDAQLVEFCRIFKLEDGEGDYKLQKEELRLGISQLVAGSVDNELIDTILVLVQEKVLPDSNGQIIKEDLLKRFGVSSERELFPAPPVWEKLDVVIKRKQHDLLRNEILHQSGPFIIHAPGGVGKSVFCRHFASAINEDSISISYDCFGAGTYRSRSTPRHRHKDALVQIGNELAVLGICKPLIARSTDSEVDIMKRFIFCVTESIQSLKRTSSEAQLFILIDAADNAEMAAEEFGQACFAHELLAELLPEDCKIIMLCRTERIHLLQPRSNVIRLELEPFSEKETFLNLKNRFPDAIEKDAQEFHRLTAGNPRVQANALDFKSSTVEELLDNLGPSGTTVQGQIEKQLEQAIARMKDLVPIDFSQYVDSICIGLASLPPHIPISVLAEAASVKPEDVKSFVADMGRALWLSDLSVQFRDEPTETWFRETFCANKSDFEKYLEKLEPLAERITYVAETLPQLYLQAEQFSKLIEIALSDKFLPQKNPIDARNVRVYRLQFAFKAALKVKRYKDAAILAVRAGEEIAGDRRQLQLFEKNIDLLVALQDPEKVQEIAFRRRLNGKWNGSENIYSASLLSSIPEYRGEARVFLRSALNWLDIYLEDFNKKKEKDKYSGFDVDQQEFLEFAFSLLNINGLEESLDFINRLSNAGVFSTMQLLTKRLIEQSRFENIDAYLLEVLERPYYTIPIVSELMKISMIPDADSLKKCLELLSNEDTRIDPGSTYLFEDPITPLIVDFIEACIINDLDKEQILTTIRHYIPLRASQMLTSDHNGKERTVFLRGLAIRMFFKDLIEINYDEIIPEVFLSKSKKIGSNNEITSYKEVINGLLPWYSLRLKVLSMQVVNLTYEINNANIESRKALSSRHRQYDIIDNEIAKIQLSLLIHSKHAKKDEIEHLYQSYVESNKNLSIYDRISIVRAASYLPHLSQIRANLEVATATAIGRSTSDGPETISDSYIDLARAVLVRSQQDASVYFDEAIDIVSKFGDEIYERWNAISTLAKRASDNGPVSDETAYQFIRCAEVAGEHMREKHWDRSDAIILCSRLSTGGGISALSRWRDRDIGYFDRMLKSLLFELVSEEKIQPPIAWALTRLLPDHHINDLLSQCLKKQKDSAVQQFILNDAIAMLQLEGCSSSYWHEIDEIAKKYNLHNLSLDKICAFYPQPAKVDKKAKEQIIIETESEVWEQIFLDCDMRTSIGLSKAHENLEKLEEQKAHFFRIAFWSEIIKRIEENDVFTLIDAALSSDFVDFYEIRGLFEAIPQNWRCKVSFVKRWPQMIYSIGNRYAYDLTKTGSLKYFIDIMEIETTLLSNLKNGAIDCFANDSEFNNTADFFGFVSLIGGELEISEAQQVLEYSLERMELHIEDDFGDGKWSDWLRTSNSTAHNIAGIIWSALGSPRSEIRWNAVHTVKTLSELHCVDVIDNLVEWQSSQKVGAFGSNIFPFYNLHACLYLFIALARVSIDSPNLLKKYNPIYLQYALEEHTLIQKYAFEIGYNIEKAFPGTYEAKDLVNMAGSIKSNMTVKKINWRETTDTIWHARNEVESIEFYFAWDFDRYWYEPLANVFGVPGNQVEDLAAHIIARDWNIQKDQRGFYRDPRSRLWNNSNERETWHSHGTYPRTDNLDFYHSYHAMFIVSARLLKNMPVVSSRDEAETPWEDWLSGHLLSRNNSKWLAELRDPLPLYRPRWLGSEKTDKWKEQIRESDFLKCLKSVEDGNTWININGGWREMDDSRKEVYSVSVSIVSPQSSDSLMNAINTCSNPYDYFLPTYEYSDGEIDEFPFVLKGLLENRHRSKGLDEFDPYANRIDFPPIMIGERIQEQLALIVNEDEKIWYIQGSSTPSLVCEIWNSPTDWSDKESKQSGHRLRASLSFLLNLCTTLKCDLIFEVSIKRDFTYSSRDEKSKYKHPKKKIYILSANGELRNAKRSYRLR